MYRNFEKQQEEADKERALMEKFKREMSRAIKRKLIEVEKSPTSIE